MSDGGTRLEIDENALQAQIPRANALVPFGYEQPRWDEGYASGLPRLAYRDRDQFQRPSDVFRYMGRVAGDVGQQLWDVGPGTIRRVMQGELQPGTPEFNQAATETASTYAMMGGPVPRPRGSLGQFGAYHGTRARFTRFDDDFIGSGEGHQSYGQGHYVGGAEATGESYQRSIGGRGLVPADDRGMPITDRLELAKKYFEPGSIVPSYGGYDRVVRFNDLGHGGWTVDVREVVPKVDPHPSGHPQPGFMSRHVREPNNPDLWEDVGHMRRHSTGASDWDLDRVAKWRGWQMRPPGHLMDVWVKPEHHEFLDWDLPLSKQDPDVLKRLQDNGVFGTHDQFMDGLVYASRDDFDFVTGQDLYHRIADAFKPAARAEGYEGREAAIQAQMKASKLLDSYGIAGNRYLDQFSRDPHLEYRGTEEMHPIVENYFQGGKGLKDTTYLKDAVDRGTDLNEVYKANEKMFLDAKKQRDPNATLSEHDKDWLWGNAYQTVDDHLEALDWLDKNKHHFQQKKQTHNYVVFNPDNLEIRAIDKIPVSRFEGDPFFAK